MKRLEFIFVSILVLFVLVGGYVSYRVWRRSHLTQNRVTVIVTPEPSPSPSFTPEPSETTGVTVSPSPTIPPLPDVINLNVPFTSQAPESNWDAFHEETCEEAAILTAQWYAFGKVGKQESGYANRIPVAEAEKSLLDIVAWERNNVSDWKDTTAAETLRIAKEFLGLHQAHLVDGVTTSDFKHELAKGNVVVVPTAGRLLNNPNFKAPGPPYHMIVLRGYTAIGFITNDPGTRNGEGYVYSESTINNAWHDWTGSAATIESGLKKAIIVGRE